MSSTGAWKGPFGYGGAFGYQSDDSGLQLLGHRYYDPSLGRFLTRDPIQDGRNWYAYCENDPVNFADPRGLSSNGLGASLPYGMYIHILRMPPHVRDMMLRLLGLTLQQAQDKVARHKEAVGLIDEFIDHASKHGNMIQMTESAQKALATPGSGFVQSTTTKFAESGNPGMVAVRVVNGTVQSMAGYGNQGERLWRIDFWSQKGRTEHLFPHHHIYLGGQEGWSEAINGYPQIHDFLPK